jgi:hypothetical protein
MDLKRPMMIEGIVGMKQNKAFPADTYSVAGPIQDPEAWPFLEPDAICEGFYSRSIIAVCTKSEANPTTGNIQNYQEEI